VRLLSLGAQRQPLSDAEAVLFIDNGKAERTEFHVLLEQRVSADGDSGSSRGYRGTRRVALLLGLVPGEPRDFQA